MRPAGSSKACGDVSVPNGAPPCGTRRTTSIPSGFRAELRRSTRTPGYTPTGNQVLQLHEGGATYPEKRRRNRWFAPMDRMARHVDTEGRSPRERPRLRRNSPMTSRFSSALVMGVLGSLGVVAWSGCGSGSESRYYCDSTGCFTCDAYGCSPVNAAARPTCSGSSGCKAGSVCTATGCATSCQSDAACPRGETCQSGLCAAPGTSPGPIKDCTTTADCGSGRTCNAGACETCGGSDGPCPCTASTDCTGGLTCIAGACTAPQNGCTYSSECADDKVCADGQCLATCDASCTDGFACEKGVCRPKPGGGTDPACTGDAQCTTPEAPSCVSGACVKSCAADGDCGSGKYCNQGACVVDTRPTPNCTADDQCGGTSATPKKCLGGFCKFTCSTSEYCRTIDNRIGYCAKDGVCRTAAEANASCFAATDCPTGASCIDNRCK